MHSARYGYGILFRLITVIAAFISAALLVLALPAYDIGWLVWLGLLPLLIVIYGRRPKFGFFFSLACGMLFFMGIFDWILEVPGYTFVHHGMLAVYLGSYFGLFGLIFAFITRWCGPTSSFFAAPFVWVCLEYIRSNLFFLALPWGLLAHSQYQVRPIIQIASISGTYGISFLIVFVNSALATMIVALLSKSEKISLPHIDDVPSKREAKSIVFIASALVTLTLLYGYVSIARQTSTEKVGLAAVQGNIAQNKKWDPKYAKFIMQTYAALTQEAGKHKPSLIIWPETATPKSIRRDKMVHEHVRQIVNKAGTYLLLGSSQRQKFKKSTSNKIKFFNSAFLISPNEDANYQQYSKIRLFPFGEYLPMKETIPWSYIGVPDIYGYASGEEFIVFEGPSFKFGVTICWENLFPNLTRKFVKSGAQFIVNITNEAWFSKTTAPYQFVSMNVFRAVENRRFVIRCANTGISCIIDPSGNIVDRLKDETGQEIFSRGVLHGEISLEDDKTFYTKHGDVFALLCLLISAVFMATAFLKKKTAKHLKKSRS